MGAVVGLAVAEGSSPVPVLKKKKKKGVLHPSTGPRPLGTMLGAKLLSELLCDAGGPRTLGGLSTMIVRLGQVAGAVRLPGAEW